MTGTSGESAGLRRVAVLARGVAALRCVQALRELESEAPIGRRAIVLHADADARARFVHEADEAIGLGAAADSVAAAPEALERALVEARADALFVGTDRADLLARAAGLCGRLGIAFVGPSLESLRVLGDVIATKRIAERAEIPIAPWAEIASADEAAAVGERIGWPVGIAAAAPGAPLCRAADSGGVAAAFAAARNAAPDGPFVLEALPFGARLIDVDAVVDRAGTCWVVGIRDVTVAWDGRHVLAEAPATLDPVAERTARSATERVLAALGLHGVATVAFRYDPHGRTLGFVGVRAGFDAARAATEAAADADLVKADLRIASDVRLAGRAPVVRGHAFAARLAAEDAEQRFAAAPGTVTRLRLPAGSGVRVDVGSAEGDVLPHGVAATLAEIASVGSTRAEALARLRRALAATDVVIDGGASTKAFLFALLHRPEVAHGTCDEAWLARLVADDRHVVRRHAHVALVTAAIEAYEEARALDEARFYADAARGRPPAHFAIGRRVELRHRGRRYAFTTREVGAGSWVVEVETHRLRATVDRIDAWERRVGVAGVVHRVLVVRDRTGHRIEVDGVEHRIRRDDAGVVAASAPAIVVDVLVAAGDRVGAGDRLVVLEAMKMESAVLAPAAGRVRRVLTTPNAQVGIGTPLLEVEPEGEPGDEAAGDRVDFAVAAIQSPLARRQALASLHALVLGYDVEAAELEPLFAPRAGDEQLDAGTAASEEDVLAAFADVDALFRPRRDELATRVPAPEDALRFYVRAVDAGVGHLPADFVACLRSALARYGVTSFAPGAALRHALVALYRAHDRRALALRGVRAVLESRLVAAERHPADASPRLGAILERLVAATEGEETAFAELVRQLRHRLVEAPRYERVRHAVYARVQVLLDELAAGRDGVAGDALVGELVECPQPLVGTFLARFADASRILRGRMLEVLLRRYYRIRPLVSVELVEEGDCVGVGGEYVLDDRKVSVLMIYTPADALAAALRMLTALVGRMPETNDVVVDVLVWKATPLAPDDEAAAELARVLDAAGFTRPLRRAVFAVAGPESGHAIAGMQHFTFRASAEGYREERVSRHLHPMMGKRLQLWRLAEFDVERLPSPADVYLLHGVARAQPKDERLFVFAEVRDATLVRDETGAVVAVPELERMLRQALAAMRDAQALRAPEEHLHWNRVLLYVWPPLLLTAAELRAIAQKLAPATDGLGLEKVVVRARMPVAPGGDALHDTVIHLATPAGRGLQVRFAEPADRPIRPLSEYGQKVVKMRTRHLVYPYEVVRMMTPGRDEVDADFPPGAFVEHDLDAAGDLVPVERPPGNNTANIVVGVIRNVTPAYPEGMTRVILLGDPSRAMGALAEPECRRINAALALAERMRVPLEWIAISAGAKISKESGTENMDWIALVLRRLIEFTQRGGEVNVVVAGINVGAQPYWNAEATMLMHTRGILVMVPDGAMVLTGKSALDYSGGVSAEDNLGIGGHDRTMGPNGQAQYWAQDVPAACRLLLRHYEYAYVAPGERFPRRVPTTDPVDRDVTTFPHGGAFATVGEVFSDATNPGRKRPFDIRRVMLAAADQDRPPLERWAAMRGAEIAVVWDAHLGGMPVALLGIEAQPLPRRGFVPADGPDQWTAGTLFPRASKKMARAINAASGNRPLVVLATLAGFDGSPESMRELQLEYGAEIGRAVVNFRGPIVFCVVSRYHGGAFVVFSRALHEGLEAVALEGAHASVIGGAPAAAVVFAGEVDARTRADARVRALDAEIAAATGSERARLRARREELVVLVRSETLGVVAAEYDRIHSVRRALEMGSLDRVIAPTMLRPYLVDAVERGVQRTLAAEAAAGGARGAERNMA